MLMRVLYPSVCRPLLFMLSPEVAHSVTFKMLDIADALKLSFLYASRVKGKPVKVMGLTFPNPVGLAAGLDKNGAYLDALAPLGFGFIEVGTVTPRPQPGNPKPRMFRIPDEKAIINRMGFNNDGIDAVVANIKQSQYFKDGGIIGVNIGKNKDTPLEKAVDDYLICLEKAYPYASYIAVNISSPNTPNLRQLQQESELDALLGPLNERQAALHELHGKFVPLVVKIAPDLDESMIDTVATVLLRHKIDGVIATNTTITRDSLKSNIDESGGLSGAPLRTLSNHVLQRLAEALKGRIPIIGVGGINSADDAAKKIELGASLVEIYSGFIFEGPTLIPECVQRLSEMNIPPKYIK